MDSNENAVAHHETPTFGNPDLPQEGMVTTTGDPASAKMTGPQNPALEAQFPNVITAPATDVSTQPFFWSSFNISPRRQQRGGWAREVTQKDFAISEEVSGVNMYLEPGGIRELHWHQTGEWAIMTQGKCRVTTLSRDGMPSVEDVFKEDLWFFPAGLPHSLQGVGPDGAEFVIVFDDGSQSESNTLLITDWFAHTPPDVLAKNFAVAQEVFDDISLHNLWIFPGDEPGDLEADQVAAGVRWGETEPVIFRMSEVKPMYENSGGSVRIADSTNFPATPATLALRLGSRSLSGNPSPGRISREPGQRRPGATAGPLGMYQGKTDSAAPSHGGPRRPRAALSRLATGSPGSRCGFPVVRT
jgi:oxalate decarboxylase